MDCQLEAAAPALEPISPLDRLRVRLARGARKLTVAVGRAVDAAKDSLIPPEPVAALSPALEPVSLGLQPGERVRVKSRAQIAATLDPGGRHRGLAYVPAMDRFCGKELTVKKRVSLFFDERTRTQCKVKDVVILEGTYCEPALSEPSAFAGCQRTCFLFWKEAWLERLDDAQR